MEKITTHYGRQLTVQVRRDGEGMKYIMKFGSNIHSLSLSVLYHQDSGNYLHIWFLIIIQLFGLGTSSFFFLSPNLAG